jgi:hypothetical protein
MDKLNPEVLDANFSNTPIQRRKLLPWWIKFFVWVFMAGGVLAVLGVILGLTTNIPFQMALYGLSTHNPASLTGLFLTALFFIKGVVSYGLWVEKNWAIDVAQADAVLGIVICTVVMFMPFIDSDNGFRMNFRLELALLIPYLIKLRNIKPQWMRKEMAS